MTLYSTSIDDVTEHVKGALKAGTIVAMGKKSAIIIELEENKVTKEEIEKFMPYEDITDSFIINKIRYIVTKPYTYDGAIALQDELKNYSRSNCERKTIYNFFIQYEEDEEHDSDEIIQSVVY